MNIPFIFTSGIIVGIIFLIGVLYTFKEFKEMYEHPDEYSDRDDNIVVHHKEKKKP